MNDPYLERDKDKPYSVFNHIIPVDIDLSNTFREFVPMDSSPSFSQRRDPYLERNKVIEHQGMQIETRDFGAWPTSENITIDVEEVTGGTIGQTSGTTFTDESTNFSMAELRNAYEALGNSPLPDSSMIVGPQQYRDIIWAEKDPYLERGDKQ